MIDLVRSNGALPFYPGTLFMKKAPIGTLLIVWRIAHGSAGAVKHRDVRERPPGEITAYFHVGCPSGRPLDVQNRS